MNKAPTIYYHKKFDRPDAGIKAGRELITIDYNTGWVEHVQRTQDLYFYNTIDSETALNFYRNVVTARLTGYLKNRDSEAVGLLRNLIEERQTKPFSLPLFASFDQAMPVLSCGASRFIASVLTGNDITDIPIVWQIPQGHAMPFESAIKIESTEHFEELCKLDDVQYRIGFVDTDTVPRVINSSLINSKYDLAIGGAKDALEKEGDDAFEFWKEFKDEETGQICITVSCDEQNQHLIEYDTNLWKVEFTALEVPDFSFMHILQKFAYYADDHKLRLEIRQITQPMRLEFLLPMVRKSQVWYYTQDQRLCLYDNSHGPASATCPIGILPNFVK
jgi:hypothetical protein